MMSTPTNARAAGPTRDQNDLAERFAAIRRSTLDLTESLSAEDQQIQAFPEASPTKWHLAHTTWFFEAFILQDVAPSHRSFHDGFSELFNSYYEGMGPRHPRAARGALSRPTLGEVEAYRRHVDDAVQALLGRPCTSETLRRVELGLHHEQQHQELILTDILANFSLNPLRPAWRERTGTGSPPVSSPGWVEIAGGVHEVGADPSAFHFDNEGPRHQTLLPPYSLRQTLVTNLEVVGFIEEGGYRTPSLWLSDGIDWVRRHGVEAPRYWRRGSEGWTTFTLYGEQRLDPHAPAVHLSGYEAEAIATWLGARLPTEYEWEVAARQSGLSPQQGRWLGNGLTQPSATVPDHARELCGLWGEVWEWTRSAYSPYPGYRPPVGALGEYNGKFMCNQWVLRGGSCASPPGHLRASYRNFFYPAQTWQFSGLRLAKEVK